MFEKLAVLVELFDGVGMVGAWAIHEHVEVVRQALLGLLAHAISCGDQHGVCRLALILFVLLALCVEGPSSWSTCLALPLSWPPLKTALTASLPFPSFGPPAYRRKHLRSSQFL